MISLREDSAGAVAPITIPALSELRWLIHGFSTRLGGASGVYKAGDLNLGFTADDEREIVRANRERLLAHLVGANERSAYGLVTVRQTHSATVHLVNGSQVVAGGSPAALEGDGLMTDAAGVLLGILTADCAPVLLVDARRRAVAAFHAGWRGTVQQIVERGVERMGTEFGSAPEDLLAAVGPAIGACCYRVGEEVREQFARRFDYADKIFVRDDQGFQLDLAEANRRQLMTAGVSSGSIAVAGGCTSCETARFFSHRAEHGATGRMMAVVGIGVSSTQDKPGYSG